VSLVLLTKRSTAFSPRTAGNIQREFYGKRFDEVQTSLAIHYTFTAMAEKARRSREK